MYASSSHWSTVETTFASLAATHTPIDDDMQCVDVFAKVFDAAAEARNLFTLLCVLSLCKRRGAFRGAGPRINAGDGGGEARAPGRDSEHATRHSSSRWTIVGVGGRKAKGSVEENAK